MSKQSNIAAFLNNSVNLSTASNKARDMLKAEQEDNELTVNGNGLHGLTAFMLLAWITDFMAKGSPYKAARCGATAFTALYLAAFHRMGGFEILVNSGIDARLNLAVTTIQTPLGPLDLILNDPPADRVTVFDLGESGKQVAWIKNLKYICL